MSANPNDPRVIEQMKVLSGEERIRIGMEGYEMLRSCMEAHTRMRHPEWNDEQIRAVIRAQFDRRKLRLDEWENIEQAIVTFLREELVLRKGAAAAP